jgi:hypothetical protein
VSTETTTKIIQAVLETSYDEKGLPIPTRKFPVTIQVTEKTLRSGQFADDTAVAAIKLAGNAQVPDGDHYTLIYTHQGKEVRSHCRVSAGSLLSSN